MPDQSITGYFSAPFYQNVIAYYTPLLTEFVPVGIKQEMTTSHSGKITIIFYPPPFMNPFLSINLIVNMADSSTDFSSFKVGVTLKPLYEWTTESFFSGYTTIVINIGSSLTYSSHVCPDLVPGMFNIIPNKNLNSVSAPFSYAIECDRFKYKSKPALYITPDEVLRLQLYSPFMYNRRRIFTLLTARNATKSVTKEDVVSLIVALMSQDYINSTGDDSNSPITSQLTLVSTAISSIPQVSYFDEKFNAVQSLLTNTSSSPLFSAVLKITDFGDPIDAILSHCIAIGSTVKEINDTCLSVDGSVKTAETHLKSLSDTLNPISTTVADTSAKIGVLVSTVDSISKNGATTAGLSNVVVGIHEDLTSSMSTVTDKLAEYHNSDILAHGRTVTSLSLLYEKLSSVESTITAKLDNVVSEIKSINKGMLSINGDGGMNVGTMSYLTTKTTDISTSLDAFKLATSSSFSSQDLALKKASDTFDSTMSNLSTSIDENQATMLTNLGGIVSNIESVSVNLNSAITPNFIGGVGPTSSVVRKLLLVNNQVDLNPMSYRLVTPMLHSLPCVSYSSILLSRYMILNSSTNVVADSIISIVLERGYNLYYCVGVTFVPSNTVVHYSSNSIPQLFDLA